MPFAGGLHSGQFFLMDVDADGSEDLVVFDRAGDVLQVFTDDAGNFRHNPDLSYHFPPDLQNWIYLADYNCDGKKDIFTYSSFGVRVFTNTTQAGEHPSWELTHDPVFTASGSTTVNLLVNPSDMPAITDVDGDGDLDILAFNFSSGETVNLFENLSMNDTGACGLVFTRSSQRWGSFSECDCGHYEFGVFSCSSPSGRAFHIGGKTLLLHDLTGDGLPEVIIGEENCEDPAVLVNTGTAGEAIFSETSFLFGAGERPYTGVFFPSVFSGDFNKDGTADLVLSSNHREDLLGLDYANSVFLLRGSPSGFAAAEPFLQHQMFDVGENAVPVAFDANNDGLPDLLVANKGLPGGEGFAATVSLLQNKGSGRFEVAAADWMGLSTLGLTNLSLQLVDFDLDGRQDLVLKGYGLNVFGLKMLWIPNRQGVFDPENARSLSLDINATDNPFFVDVNSDGTLDVLLGQSNGRLSLWINSGSNETPQYSEKTNAYLGVNLDPGRTFLVPIVTHADGNSEPDLLLADNSGQLRLFRDFLSGSGDYDDLLMYNEALKTSVVLDAGRRIWPAMADLNGDNVRELIVGTARGGIQIFTGTDESGNPSEETKLRVQAYPNPLQESRKLTISSNLDATAVLYNLSGQRLAPELELQNGLASTISLAHLPTGLYLLRVRSGQQSVTKKIIVGP